MKGFRPARLALLASLVCATAAPAFAQMTTRAPSLEAGTRSAVPYLALAGAGDIFEITSSQMAIQRSRNPDVRRFATMLIDHHSRTTNLALAAAKAGGVMADPAVLTPEQRAMIDELLAAPAAGFDLTYLRQQVPAHQQALALHSGYASSGDVDTLRTTARGAVPIVQSHLVQAQRLSGTIR